MEGLGSLNQFNHRRKLKRIILNPRLLSTLSPAAAVHQKMLRIAELFLKGEFTFFYSRIGCPPIRGVHPDGD